MQPITQKELIKDIKTKLGILAHHDKVQLQDYWHDFESYNFRAIPIFNFFQNFKLNDGP